MKYIFLFSSLILTLTNIRGQNRPLFSDYFVQKDSIQFLDEPLMRGKDNFLFKDYKGKKYFIHTTFTNRSYTIYSVQLNNSFELKKEYLLELNKKNKPFFDHLKTHNSLVYDFGFMGSKIVFTVDNKVFYFKTGKNNLLYLKSVKSFKNDIRVVMNNLGFFQYNSQYSAPYIPIFFVNLHNKSFLVDSIENPEFLMVNNKNIISVYNNSFCIRAKENYDLKYGRIENLNPTIKFNIKVNEWQNPGLDKIKDRKRQLGPNDIAELAIPLYFFNKKCNRLVDVMISDSNLYVIKTKEDSSFMDIIKIETHKMSFSQKNIFIYSKFNIDTSEIIKEYPVDLVHNFSFICKDKIGVFRNAELINPVGKTGKDYIYFTQLFKKATKPKTYLFKYEYKSKIDK